MLVNINSRTNIEDLTPDFKEFNKEKGKMIQGKTMIQVRKKSFCPELFCL
jgi:hypothetical protein